jgi:hypothetical protein
LARAGGRLGLAGGVSGVGALGTIAEPGEERVGSGRCSAPAVPVADPVLPG